MSEGSSKKISKSDWKGKLRELKERQKELKDKPLGERDGHKRVNFFSASLSKKSKRESSIPVFIHSFARPFVRPFVR